MDGLVSWKALECIGVYRTVDRTDVAQGRSGLMLAFTGQTFAIHVDRVQGKVGIQCDDGRASSHSNPGVKCPDEDPVSAQITVGEEGNHLFRTRKCVRQPLDDAMLSGKYDVDPQITANLGEGLQQLLVGQTFGNGSDGADSPACPEPGIVPITLVTHADRH